MMLTAWTNCGGGVWHCYQYGNGKEVAVENRKARENGLTIATVTSDRRRVVGSETGTGKAA